MNSQSFARVIRAEGNAEMRRLAALVLQDIERLNARELLEPTAQDVQAARDYVPTADELSESLNFN
jgi:hypothetical protein